MEGLEHIDHIEYGKVTKDISNNTRNKIDELNIEDAESAYTFLSRSELIIQQLNQLEIIEENIDYDATINSILHNSAGTPPKTINIPINDIHNTYNYLYQRNGHHASKRNCILYTNPVQVYTYHIQMDKRLMYNDVLH